jgi:hypothetical protein
MKANTQAAQTQPVQSSKALRPVVLVRLNMIIFPRLPMAKPSGFFCEPNGDRSMGRLMAFIMMLAAIWFGYEASRKPVEQSGAAVQVMISFLAGATATKTIPKFAPQDQHALPEAGR